MEPGEIIMQTGIAWAESDEEAIAGAAKWKPTALDEVYLEDIHDPDDMQRRADSEIDDSQFAREGFVISSDVDEHVERIRQIEAAGPTTVCLQVIGSADPMGTIRTYGEKVLPALRS